MRLHRFALLFAIFVLMLPRMHGQLRTTGRYAVPLAEVTRAITAALARESRSGALPEVVMLSNVTASVVSPQLDIISTAPVPAGKSPAKIERMTAVRMGCHQPHTCMPFYAIATWPQGHSNTLAENSFPAIITPAPKQALIHAGARMSLVLDDGNAHLDLPVVSLERGNIDQDIRVSSLDRKRTYSARIVTPTLVRGSF